MKKYFILLSSGLVVESESKATYCKFPQGDKWLVVGAALKDAGGKLLRNIDKMYIDTNPAHIAARWEEPSEPVISDPVAVLQSVA